MGLTGYHSQIHFKCNELELFYNLPIISSPDSDKRFDPCPHIKKLQCSRAHELAPDKCISTRKCELYELKSELFHEQGIHGSNFKKLDEKLRKK